MKPDCEPTEFEIYFGVDDTDLSPESKAIMTAMSDIHKACEIERLQVTGYSDAVGDAATNLEVFRARKIGRRSPFGERPGPEPRRYRSYR